MRALTFIKYIAKGLGYLVVLISGAFLAYLNYIIGYGIYWELTHVANRPTPWVLIWLLALTVILLDLTAILQFVSYRMLKKL